MEELKPYFKTPKKRLINAFCWIIAVAAELRLQFSLLADKVLHLTRKFANQHG